MVRVTREKVLDRFAREVFAARRDALSPDDFAPLAYLAACEVGLDDITGGPAGQLRFLIDPAAVVAGIPGVGVENARIVIEETPAEVVRQLREDHGFLEQPDDEPPWGPAGAEPADAEDLPFWLDPDRCCPVPPRRRSGARNAGGSGHGPPGRPAPGA